MKRLALQGAGAAPIRMRSSLTRCSRTGNIRSMVPSVASVSAMANQPVTGMLPTASSRITMRLRR